MKIKIKGISIDISYPSIALLSVVLITGFATNYILCSLSILLHESGHILAMLIYKSKVTYIKISPFDLKIITGERTVSVLHKEVLITLAGPAANLLMFLIFININSTFAQINMALGLFNLIPCASLDGGQIIYLLLSERITAKTCENIVFVLSLITLIPVFVFGILMLLQSKYNFSLLFIGMYLLLALFLKKSKFI